MSKASDVYAGTRHTRNLSIALLIIAIFVGVSSYASITLLVYLFEGNIILKSLFALNLQTQAFFAAQKFAVYWQYWATYTDQLGLVGQNYFTIKLFAVTFAPYTMALFFVMKHKEFITEKLMFQKDESLHGDAHWATPEEIKKNGLFNDEGLLMGEYKPGKYFIGKDYQHVLLFAPTGSGKGVGFVIPNLLFWKESVMVHDIKLENLQLTSGYRANVLKQKVYAWIPAATDGLSHCYNPLDWISKNQGQMVDDVQKITSILIEKQEFWENEARALITGVILFAIADPNRSVSFGEVVRILRSDDTAYTLASGMDAFGSKLHPVGYMNISAFLQKAEKERSGVISTANSRLDLWTNPIIDQITSRSDFDISRFRKDLTTVYVGLTPDNIARLKPLMSMFYQQATSFLSRKMPEKDEPYGVLFLMDEFPTLGKMEQFLSGIAYFRGYHVKLFLIIQDTQQLKSAYEDSGMNSFLSNSTYRVTFAANNIETAKLISELVGNKTVDSESTNKARYFDMNPANRTINVSKAQRALLLPQEVIGMDRDLQIILIEASAPIKCKKIKYYSDPFFVRRLMKQISLPKQEPKIVNRGGTGNNNSSIDDKPDDVRLLSNHPNAKAVENPPQNNTA